MTQESREERANRARDYKQWTKVNIGPYDILDYVELCRKDDCYYTGNTERIGSCEISRLNGTDTVFLCDVCMNNNLNRFADALEEHDDNLYTPIH
jgi:hypothetical protein